MTPYLDHIFALLKYLHFAIFNSKSLYFFTNYCCFYHQFHRFGPRYFLAAASALILAFVADMKGSFAVPSLPQHSFEQDRRLLFRAKDLGLALSMKLSWFNSFHSSTFEFRWSEVPWWSAICCLLIDPAPLQAGWDFWKCFLMFDVQMSLSIRFRLELFPTYFHAVIFTLRIS